VVAVAFLVSLDSLRTERLTIPATILSALIVAGIVLGSAAIVGVNDAHAGLRAAVLLVLWYGARGVAGAVVGPERNRELMVEYAVFVVAAVAGVIWILVAHF
jgi:heme/copper-type cytochrome/quinol oxidase subunit 4